MRADDTVYVIVTKADGSNMHAANVENGKITGSRCFKRPSALGRTVQAQVIGDQGILDYAGAVCADCLSSARFVLDAAAEQQARLDREGRAAGKRIAITLYIDVPETATLVSVADVRKNVEQGFAMKTAYVTPAEISEATVVEAASV